MSIMGGDGGGQGWAYGLLIMSAVTLVFLSLLIPFCCPQTQMGDSTTTYSELENQYLDFTGSAPTSESVWALTGIFTPYGVDANGDPYDGYGYTSDGWLYGARVVNYIPSQYNDKQDGYLVAYNADDGYYYYANTSTQYNQHTQGDLYGSVVMDVAKQSSIFFTSSGKVTNGDFFYYSFDGYRYAFQPLNEYSTLDANGDEIRVIPNTTSLSLIWYNYYGDQWGPGGTGLAGQLIITGSDSGVAYLTGAMIVSAFDSDTSTSKFVMTFNGVDMNVYIRLDATMLASGLTVEECYYQGYWSVMVSSRSVDTSSTISSDYAFNVYEVFDTMIDLLTFNTDDYGLTGMAGELASIAIVLPLLLGLIIIGLNNYPVLIIAGIYGVISAWNFMGGA